MKDYKATFIVTLTLTAKDKTGAGILVREIQAKIARFLYEHGAKVTIE